MGKRKTYGGGDVYPQWMVFSAKQTGSDTLTTVTVTLPIAPFQQSGLVVEVLKAVFELDTGTTSLTTDQYVACGLTTKSTGMAATVNAQGSYFMSDPNVFAYANWGFPGVLTSGGGIVVKPQWWNPCDEQGHGQFVVTPNIYMTIASVNANTNVVRCRVLYRVRSMPINEFLGYYNAQQPLN